MDLKLTDTERLMLSNQYEILHHLQGNQGYDQVSKQLRDGHEWLYRQWFQHLSPVMSEGDAAFVLAIAGLYDKLRISWATLEDKGDLTEDDVRFPGFDGNDSYETELMGFAAALVEDRRYVDALNEGRSLNSHYQAVPGYKQMLKRHIALGSPANMTLEQIKAVLNAEVV
jgi:uncharacterized protein YfbU (UPF0304 family)